MMRKKESGFTLIELMVVIVIIGVLASLAIPRFSDASTKAKVAEAPRVIASYESAQLAALAEGSFVATGDLVFTQPTSKFWSYAGGFAANATYVATARTVGGKIASNATLTTTIDASGVITHTGTAALLTYVKNF